MSRGNLCSMAACQSISFWICQVPSFRSFSCWFFFLLDFLDLSRLLASSTFGSSRCWTRSKGHMLKELPFIGHESWKFLWKYEIPAPPHHPSINFIPSLFFTTWAQQDQHQRHLTGKWDWDKRCQGAVRALVQWWVDYQDAVRAQKKISKTSGKSAVRALVQTLRIPTKSTNSDQALTAMEISLGSMEIASGSYSQMGSYSRGS